MAFRISDAPQASVYRVNIITESHYAAVNVLASSPTAAREWLLSYPQYAGVPMRYSATVTHSYKLRRQPVWLRKIGHSSSRFDLRSLVKVEA